MVPSTEPAAAQPVSFRFLRGRSAALSPEEHALLDAAIDEVRSVPARTTLVARREPLDHSTLVLDGFLCRTITDRDAQRQIVSFEVPGDFPDLHGFPLKWLDHHVVSLTEVRVARIPHRAVARILRHHPDLARKLWYSTELDGAMHREWLFRLGRLDATGRVAHFLCETEARLRCVGLSDGRSYALPITQLDLADICGLTSIHVNRVLRHLREEELCTFRAGHVDIAAPQRLAERGEFEPAYLYLADEHGVPSANLRE